MKVEGKHKIFLLFNFSLNFNEHSWEQILNQLLITRCEKCWKHVGVISSGTLTSSPTYTSLVIASNNVELVGVLMCLIDALNYQLK